MSAASSREILTGATSSAVARRLALESLRTDTVTAECVRALDAAGVPQLLLKGPTTARWLYGDGRPRPYGDSDLLVPVALRDRARAVLADIGFVDRLPGRRCPQESAHHAIALYRQTAGGLDNVDLHHRLGLVTDPAAPLWEVLSRDAVETVVAGQRVRMPGDAGRCLVIALHAAQDGQYGAKPLADLRRARRTADAPTWSAATALATELGVEQALRLGCVLAGAPLPDTAEQAGWSDTPLELRLRVIGAGPAAGSLARLRRHHGWALVKYIVRRLVPTRAFIAEAYNARTAPVALGAYLHRLWTFAVRVPRALRDLLAASAVPKAIDRRR